MFKCTSCKQNLTLPYIKCAECIDPSKYIYLCLECHSKNYSNKHHDSAHDYLKFEYKYADQIQKSVPSEQNSISSNSDSDSSSEADQTLTYTKTPLIFGDAESPTLTSTDLGPLDDEIAFLNFISKYGLNSKDIAKEFIARYPYASCVKKENKIKRKIEDDDYENNDIKPAKLPKNVTYPTPQYIIKHLEDPENITAAALGKSG